MKKYNLLYALEKTGRRSNGYENDQGRIAHAVPGGSGLALCGTEPQGSAAWGCCASTVVTCPKCLTKMLRLGLELSKDEDRYPKSC